MVKALLWFEAVFYTKSMIFIDRIMHAVSYINIFLISLPESAAKMSLRMYIFQHYNHPKHTSRLVCEYLDDKDIQLFEY